MAYNVVDSHSVDAKIKDKAFRVVSEELETDEGWVIEAVLLGVEPMELDPVKKFIGLLEDLYQSVRIYREAWKDVKTGRFSGMSTIVFEFGDRGEAEDYAKKLNSSLSEL